MSSATINRQPGTMPSAVRSTRFGDFTSTGNRVVDEKNTQTSSLGQFGNTSTWQASGGIWGNTIGSAFAAGKRDTSRPREEESLEVPSGSGALTASSEADPWVSRTNGPWNDTTSPTSGSGSTSPIRHRNSSHSAQSMNLGDTQTSPYLTSSRPAIGQGPSRSQSKSNLDPASGAFTSFMNAQHYGFSDDKENKTMGREPKSFDGAIPRGYGFEQRGIPSTGYRIGNGTASRDSSLPPSRHSDIAPAYPSFGHTPNNSTHIQRPSVNGRTPSFPTLTNNRSYEQTQDLELKLSRMQLGEKTSQYIDTSPTNPSFGQRNGFSAFEPQTNSSSTIWNEAATNPPKNQGYGNEQYIADTFNVQLKFNKPSRSNDRESVSPGTDYRRIPQSPKYYSENGTPVIEMSNGFVVRNQGQATIDYERNYQRQPFAQQAYFQNPSIYNPQYQAPYGPHAYDYPPPQAFRHATGQFGYQSVPTFAAPISVPRGPSRDQDVGHGVRSVVLEEFRSNTKTNKRYELKDIYNHVVEFSGDQHGSRFIQQKLETANSDEKDQIFREIQPNALQLMTDVFGNYVIQKLFEHGNQVQKRVLAEQMRNHIDELSVQMYGCRVVQKALEHVLADQQAELVKELQPKVLECVKDQNGNHVIQKAIERVPTEHIQFIIEAFKGQVHTLATHPYGCRVIQRMLEYCSEKDQASVLEELFACASMLITDQYGNYVTQHVIAHGKPEHRAQIIKIVTAQLLALSKHKFASNVVEKSIQFGTDEQRRAIVAQMTALHSDGSSPLQLMMKDQYGNYVVQKLLGQLKGAEREQLVEDIKPQLLALKKYNFGKQIAAIEKLIFTGPVPPNGHSYGPQTSMVPSSVTKTQPLDINSAVPTPLLTMEQNSPRSSSLSSANVSTVDGPTDPKASMEKVTPEVTIHTV